MRFRVSDEEYTEIRQAAMNAGMSYGAYIARTVLAASHGVPPGAYAVLDELLDELDHLADQVNVIGKNLNQMAKVANASGRVPGSLPYSLEYLAKVLRRIDETTVKVVRRLP